MRQDQREFLERDCAALIEQFSTDLDREGGLSSGALEFIRSTECVLDWLRGDAAPSPDLLAFLRTRLEESDDQMGYPEVLKKVYEHEAFTAAISELEDGPALDDRQRRLLLDEWRADVANARTGLGPWGVRMVDHRSRLIEWLEGGQRPGAETRRFLEEELEGFKKDSGYDELVQAHDRIATAIEAMG